MFSSKTQSSTNDDTAVSGLEVVQASYGAQGNFQDVTKEVQGLIKDGSISFPVSSQSIGILDPAPGIKKTFQVKTIINGGTPTIVSKEDGEVISISAPPIKTKTASSHVSNIWSILSYAFLGLFTMYFAQSGYLLGTKGLNSPILGYGLLLVTLVTLGVGGLHIILPLIFVYAFLWPTAIDYSYAVKNV